MARRGMRAVVGAVMALGLAATLAGCHGGSYDEGAGNDAPDVSTAGAFAEDLAALQELMESQNPTYTCDYVGTYTLGAGSEAQESAIDYVLQVEGDNLPRALETYAADSGYLAGASLYSQAGQVIEVNAGGDAIDMTQTVAPTEPVLSEAPLFTALLAYATDVQVTEEAAETQYTVVAEGAGIGPVELVESATALSATYTFNGDGVLLSVAATIEGTADASADALPASQVYTGTYSDWGTTTVPAAPLPIGTYEVGLGTVLSDDLLKTFAATPKNLTCVMETTTTVVQGSTSLSQDMHLEAYQDATDGLRALVYLEAPDSGIDEMYTYVADGRVTMSLNGEVISADYDYDEEDPTGLGQASKLVACAEAIDRIVYTDGDVEYILYADPQKVTDEVDLDGWGQVALCEAHYYVNTAGELVYASMNVEGIPENADAFATMTVDMQAWYSDFNTTEVFNPFE